jgi:hypothetical protein
MSYLRETCEAQAAEMWKPQSETRASALAECSNPLSNDDRGGSPRGDVPALYKVGTSSTKGQNMPTTVAVTHQPEAVDPYAGLRTSYGQKLLQLFKKGAHLCVWRCTTPWNYYLETRGRDQYTIAGKDEGEVGNGRSQLRALQQLATPAGNSSRVIERSISRFEVGLPEKEWSVYDAGKAQELEARWARAQVLFKQKQATRKPFAPDTSSLSELALALLRTMKHNDNRRAMPRFPELENEFCELEAQGIIEIARNGQYLLVPAAKTMRLPRGRRMNFNTVQNHD